MAVVRQLDLILGRAEMSKKVGKLAGSELYGLESCTTSWGKLLMSYLILESLECSGGQYLNQAELDCVTGKLTGDIKTNCC